MSGVGTLLHGISGILAKALSSKVGTISGKKLKHSGDLLNKIRNVSVRNKQLASFDVTSLFTNVPTEKALDVLRGVLSNNDSLPIPMHDFISLVELCVSNCFFTFNDVYYRQKSGMAMGSPLSGILSNLFLEHLEANYFNQVIHKDIVWLRYVDDVLVIAPRRLDLDSLRGRLNSVEPSIQFTIEYENNDRLPFLDVLLIKDNNNLKFNVFRKPTKKMILYTSIQTLTKGLSWALS